MVQTLCTSGNHEGLKCGVHGAAVALAAVMAAYNIAACCFRRDPHLRVNAVVYTLAVGWELKQTLHHLTRTGPPLPVASLHRSTLPDHHPWSRLLRGRDVWDFPPFSSWRC